MKTLHVWVFDDKWEHGWRFDDVANALYCFIPTELATSGSEAMEVLSKIHSHVKKNKGSSKAVDNTIYNHSLVLVIRE